MIYPKHSLIIGLFLLSTLVGCGQTNTQNNSILSTTPSSTAQKLTGLTKIQGNGVSLSLPDSFTGGDPIKDLDAIAAKLKTINPAYSEKLQVLKKSPIPIFLLAFDISNPSSQLLTNVGILTEKVPKTVTLEKYLDDGSKNLSKGYKIIEKKVITVNQIKSGRIIAEASDPQINLAQVFYTIPKGDTYWLVTYSTSKEELQKRLPIFEQSINTIEIK